MDFLKDVVASAADLAPEDAATEAKPKAKRQKRWVPAAVQILPDTAHM